MNGTRWSLSSNESEGWHTASSKFSQPPIPKPEEIQIILLGAPHTGKTHLQSRYTLRQFANIDSENAHLMGGHKHLRLHDGTDVHLIIHELSSGLSSGLSRNGTNAFAREEEDRRRQRLLEQSDAVMLVFNPWSKSSYEWINDKVVEDIIYKGRTKERSPEVVHLLDDLAAAMPKRSLSTRSARSAMSFGSMKKKLPRVPDEAKDSDSEESVFSNEDDEKVEDRLEYVASLKRISIAAEDSAMKKAELMMTEDDLPSPEPQNFVSGPLIGERRSKMLPTIKEDDESARKPRRVSRDVDEKHMSIEKHDSLISIESESNISNANSDLTTTVVGGMSQASEPSEPHPLFREGNTTCMKEAAHPLLREGNTTCMKEANTRALTPTEEAEVPVLVVATMSDKLIDTGGTLDRRITATQGQRLARKFGVNCAYIETSARTNANVDEAFGIIIDQVIAKRALDRRDEEARARIEAAIAAVQAEPKYATPAMRPPRAARSCAPQWTWLFGVFALVPSWNNVSEKVSQVIYRPGSSNQPGHHGPEQVVEDVWGEQVVQKPQNKSFKRHSKAFAMKLDPNRQTELMLERRPSRMWSKTISHDPMNEGSLKSLIMMEDQDETQVAPCETSKPASQQLETTISAPDPCYNPFEKDEFKRPLNMVTVTNLGSPRGPHDNKKLKSKLKGTRATSNIFESSRELSRKGFMNLPRAGSRKSSKSDLGAAIVTTTTTTYVEPRTRGVYGIADPYQLRNRSDSPASDDPLGSKSALSGVSDELDAPSTKSMSRHTSHVTTISDRAPSLPPLEFDALLLDEKRASIAVFFQPNAWHEHDEAISNQVARNDAAAARDSRIVMLSQTTTKLREFVNEINQSRGASAVAPAVPEKTSMGRRASEGVPALALMPGAYESELERRVKRVTASDIPHFQAAASEDDQGEFMTVVAYGVGFCVDTQKLHAASGLLYGAAAANQAPLPIDLRAPPATAPPEKALPPTPLSVPKTRSLPPEVLKTGLLRPKALLPPEALKKGPLPPRKKSLPPLPASPAAVAVATASATKKNSRMSAPIVTTTELRRGDSSEDDERRWPAAPRTPTNPRRPRPGARRGKKAPMVPPAEAGRSPGAVSPGWV